MILSFSGDPFLARRAAKRALAEQGVTSLDVTELGEGMTPADVLHLAGQGGLFGQVALLLDFGAAFTGQAGVKPRDEMMSALSGLGAAALIVVVDPEATPARRKKWAALGKHLELPTPRYDALQRWVRRELDDAALRYRPDAPATLADLFGEDPAAILSEINKLAALDEELTADRVRQVANRAAVHDAFDLLDSITRGDGAGAFATARQLLDEGEAAQRVMAALAWQFLLLAKAVALREREPDQRAVAQRAASVLKAKPFVVQKTLKLAQGLGEKDVTAALEALLEADVASKTGRDPEWALESVVLTLAGRFAAPVSDRAESGRTGARGAR
ncbi:MAG TPA: DNA polymerase III subunit delta [Trueperaceae bacterium]